MFSSTIIPTIGRPTLSRAVCSVLEQDFQEDDSEVIVVNDSGQTLPEMDGLGSPRVRVVDTNHRERSVARNTGAAIAKGRYLHFLDDDDWMLPGALRSFWNLAGSSQAAWLFGAFRLVNNGGTIVGEVCPQEDGNCFVHAMAAEWIPLQASMIESRAFFAVEGFASLSSLLGGYEDIDLSRKIAHRYDWAGTAHLVAGIRVGDEGSTTNYGNIASQNRQSRENALAAPGSFERMVASARASKEGADYWLPRIVFFYLSSVKLNLRRRRYLTAGGRGAYAVGTLAIAGARTLSPGFWQRFRDRHQTRVTTAVKESGVNLFTNTRFVDS